jgi:hypothetical protein
MAASGALSGQRTRALEISRDAERFGRSLNDATHFPQTPTI